MSWQQWILVLWFSFVLAANITGLVSADDRSERIRFLVASSLSMFGVWLAANA